MTMTPYTLGGASNAPATGTTLQFTLTHAVAAGDALVVAAGSDSPGETVTGITDSQGNTWTSAKSDYAQNDGQAAFYVLNAKAMTTSDTITATFSGSTGSHTILGRGCNGIGTAVAVDVAIANDAATGTSPTSGASGTLRQSSEWAVAFLINANGGGSPTAWTGGFTAAATQHATNNQYHTMADRTTTATTALTAGATITSAAWCMILVTFRAAPYLAGANTFASGTTSTVVTVGAAAGSQGVAAGDAVFVICGIGSTASAPTSITDSASQTYTLVVSEVPGNSMCSYIYAKYNSAALASGTATVTVTWSTTSGNKIVQVVGANGLATSAAFDQSAANSGSSLAPSSGATAGLAVAGEPALAVIIGGSAASSAATSTPWVQLGPTQRPSGGVYMAVGQQTASSTSGVTATGTLGVSANWSALAATFQPASGGGGGGGVTGLSITSASPLPGGTIGVPYTDQLTATGGSPPYTWAVTVGSLPAGLTLASGSGGTGSSDFTYVGANTGPQGGPTLSQFQASNAAYGPIGCYKFFFTALPSTWSGSLMDQITSAAPALFPYISWSAVMTASALANFIATIPHTIPAVGFTFDSEPENGGYTSGADFVSKYNDQATKIHAAQSTTPVQLIMMTSSYTGFYDTASPSNAYIPPASSVDCYCMDFYDRKVHWVGSDMSSTLSWKNWLGFVKNLGRPIGISEFGISGAASDTEQNTRLQNDWNYLKAAFGPGGSVSQSPLFVWLYWETGGTAFAPAGTINEWIGSQTEATWAAIEATAGGQSSGSTGTGGVISGTPTTATTVTPTIQVTDSAAATATKVLSITIAAATTLTVTSTTLPGATVNVAYSTLLTATGGTPGYTWAVTVGSLPSGLALDSASGLISGTVAATGTTNFTVRVTDSVAATATAAVSITVSAGLTVTTTSLTPAQLGNPYTFTLAASGGTSPYTWIIAASSPGGLPAGLLLDGTTGIISGTPTASGSFPVAFTATDAANATATSANMTLSVSTSTGLPDLPRLLFGGGDSDWAFTVSGTAVQIAAAVTWTFYTAPSGGTQITDLQNLSFASISSVTTDANGFAPQFYGPPGVFYMWADANGGAGPRRLVRSTNDGDVVTILHTYLKTLTG